MNSDIILTGIKTTGTPHLGNYAGAIKPAIQASQNTKAEAFYFLADYHSIISCHNPKEIRESSIQVAATWLASGLDPDKVFFYRQSDIPEIPELTWVLNCMAAKGLMNRAHSYKASVAQNIEEKAKDPDKGISMGLFSYPVLMAADILMFKATKVPVGRDQIQHIEMARDIAGKFNHIYGKHFIMPEAVVGEEVAVLSGLDGRKMSKSYNNIIPLFAPEKKLRKLIMKIKTNSLEPGEPKQTEGCTLFDIFKAFATKDEVLSVQEKYTNGIAWGEMKSYLFEYLNEQLKPLREKYNALTDSPDYIEDILQKGKDKARERSVPFLDEIRKAVGISRIK